MIAISFRLRNQFDCALPFWFYRQRTAYSAYFCWSTKTEPLILCSYSMFSDVWCQIVKFTLIFCSEPSPSQWSSRSFFCTSRELLQIIGANRSFACNSSAGLPNLWCVFSFGEFWEGFWCIFCCMFREGNRDKAIQRVQTGDKA